MHSCICLLGKCVVQVLQKAGLPDAQLAQLSTHVYQLQCAFERMAVIKEYRYDVQSVSVYVKPLICHLCFARVCGRATNMTVMA